MKDIFKVQIVGEKVFSLLKKGDLLKCRTICKTWKAILDEPIFWLKKLTTIGHTNEAHDQWLDLIQKSEKIGQSKKILCLCLMLKYCCILNPSDRRSTKMFLSLPPIYYAVKYGQLEVVKLIHHFDKDCNRRLHYLPNPKEFYVPLIIGIRNHQTEVVKYMVDNIEVNYFSSLFYLFNFSNTLLFQICKI